MYAMQIRLGIRLLEIKHAFVRLGIRVLRVVFFSFFVEAGHACMLCT
jgi:hypothetical protein